MSRRDDSLRSFAHLIAMRFKNVRQYHADHGEEVPAGVLAKHFRTMCQQSDLLTGGPVSTREMERLAAELVREAVAELKERIAA
jgi:hypothetical protein